MIRIAFDYTDDTMTAFSVGHAQGDPDQCVAVSALMWGLAGYASNLHLDCPGCLNFHLGQTDGAMYLRITFNKLNMSRTLFRDLQTRLIASFQTAAIGILQVIAIKANASQIQTEGCGAFIDLFIQHKPGDTMPNMTTIMNNWLAEADILPEKLLRNSVI